MPGVAAAGAGCGPQHMHRQQDFDTQLARSYSHPCSRQLYVSAVPGSLPSSFIHTPQHFTLHMCCSDHHHPAWSLQEIITISKDKLPGYEEKIKMFYEEHIHSDEEIRYVLDGAGEGNYQLIVQRRRADKQGILDVVV